MKRALTVALFSGLFVLAVPQGAFAHDAQGGDCGARNEKTAEHSDKQAPEEHHGDRQSHDDDGTILF